MRKRTLPRNLRCCDCPKASVMSNEEYYIGKDMWPKTRVHQTIIVHCSHKDARVNGMDRPCDYARFIWMEKLEKFPTSSMATHPHDTWRGGWR